MKITEFGDELLREKAKELKFDQIKSKQTMDLILQMKEFLITKKLGVGLAAPQIGQNLSLAIINIQSLKHRRDVKNFELVIINPKILESFGRRNQMWEGCISAGSIRGGLFAKVPRYKKIKLRYYDESGTLKTENYEGLPAQVIQHEVDHLMGILFVDRVKDTKTFSTYKQYLRIVKAKK